MRSRGNLLSPSRIAVLGTSPGCVISSRAPERLAACAEVILRRLPPGPDPEGHFRRQSLTGALQWNRTSGVKPRPCDLNYLVVPTSFPVLVAGFDRGLQRLRG